MFLKIFCFCFFQNELLLNIYLSGWIFIYFFEENDLGRLNFFLDDSFQIFLSRQVDLVEFSFYDCFLFSDNSGKDSVVVSEVEIKMFLECSDFDFDMLRRLYQRLEIRDIGYSSGISIFLFVVGYISTEFDCDDIKKFIDNVENLVGEKQKFLFRQRKFESFQKKKGSISFCDVSSEDSDVLLEEFSIVLDDVEGLYDSVLGGLEYNLDVFLFNNFLKLYNIVKFRQNGKKKKDRLWSAI